MKTRGLMTGILGMAMLGLVFTACESDSPISLEESLRDTPNVQLKEGATNVGIKVNTDYKRSYYKMELSNLLPESNMSDGTYAAWCVLYDTPIAANATEYGGVKIYDTAGDPSFQKVRYLINNKDRFMNDLGADWKDIQVAIWSVLDFPKFDYAKNLDRMPPEFKDNGTPTFNSENVDFMVSATLEAASEEVEVTENCEVYLLETQKDVQNGIVEKCETAMARMEDLPTNYTIPFSHRWFSYVSFPRTEKNRTDNPNNTGLVCPFDAEEVYFMYSNRTYVGIFCASYAGKNAEGLGEYTYAFVFETEWSSFETHVDIVSVASDFPQPIPWAFGHYTNKESFASGPLTGTGVLTGVGPVLDKDGVFISAHAVIF